MCREIMHHSHNYGNYFLSFTAVQWKNLPHPSNEKHLILTVVSRFINIIISSILLLRIHIIHLQLLALVDNLLTFWTQSSFLFVYFQNFTNFYRSYDLLVKWTAVLTCAPLTTAPSSNSALQQNSRNERSACISGPVACSQLNWDWSSAKIPSSNVLRLFILI